MLLPMVRCCCPVCRWLRVSSQQTQLPSGLQIGTGVKPVSTERIFTQGNLQQTGNSLDLAINGQGFLQVAMPDGTMRRILPWG